MPAKKIHEIATVKLPRIFEYVIDAVAPVSDQPTDTGHSIKKVQWRKLHELVNKGVHAEVYRSEVRRCFIRTVLLLDDIMAMHPQPFDIRTDID